MMPVGTPPNAIAFGTGLVTMQQMWRAGLWLNLAAIAPNPASSQSLVQQLYENLRTAVLDGRLPVGMRLPASRLLAAELGLARNTVVTAYEQLMAEGYLESRTGDGTYVSRALPDELLTCGDGWSAASGARQRWRC